MGQSAESVTYDLFWRYPGSYDIADKLAKKGQYNPIEINIRRFILKILAIGEATEWLLLKNNQELCYKDVNQID
ncbi:hypothetical protein RhiirA5_424036 [Rhizophagus irregularis]|uniref:Uncharacterized protein n=1 Tax=Rhizophagus irregularis TaxID=588596 RepID=A0A2N0P8W6_9GLOM|nr:hypothetical protein RhiirA5_424036 [Rhizophagus irregularis]GBC36270.2 hypothetical protein GLOIN_2v1791494 [Rhizophagus irregularis DAOM 181602=DAOM 197198]